MSEGVLATRPGSMGRRLTGVVVTVDWLRERAEPEPNTGCWLWSLGGHRAGYGIVRFNGRQQGTHRIMWQLVNGPIADGLYVCHHCDTPACINPDHLFVGTVLDNTRDMIRKGRAKRLTREMWLRYLGKSWAQNRAKTACHRGHVFDEANTIIRKNRKSGPRQCRTCLYASQQRYRARKAGSI